MLDQYCDVALGSRPGLACRASQKIQRTRTIGASLLSLGGADSVVEGPKVGSMEA